MVSKVLLVATTVLFFAATATAEARTRHHGYHGSGYGYAMAPGSSWGARGDRHNPADTNGF